MKNNFKVGDKVEFVEDYSDAKCGDKGTVVGLWSDGVNVKLDTKKSPGEYSCFFPRVRGIELRSLRQRIEALDNGWDKKADDILDEICGEKPIDIKIERDAGGKTGFGAITMYRRTWGGYERTFSFHSQCEKMRAFKDVLLHLLDESGLESAKEGDKAEVEVEGQKWEAKLIKKL